MALFRVLSANAVTATSPNQTCNRQQGNWHSKTVEKELVFNQVEAIKVAPPTMLMICVCMLLRFFIISSMALTISSIVLLKMKVQMMHIVTEG